MLKKWFCFLLAFGLMNTQVWAQDDDDDEDYEEAPKAKKAAPKKAAKKSSDGGSSRFGLQVSFSGDLGNQIGFVYDLGNGIELGLGLGLHRYSHTINEAPDGVENPVVRQTAAVIPSFSYNLGKGLLDYGIGVDVAVIMEPVEEGYRPDGGMSILGFPNFYAKAELVKNVSLKVAAGVSVYMEAEVPKNPPDGPVDNGTKDMVIQFVTSGTVIFYFM